MTAAFFFAGRALITLAGLCAVGVIVRQLHLYADKAIDALLMGEGDDVRS